MGCHRHFTKIAVTLMVGLLAACAERTDDRQVSDSREEACTASNADGLYSVGGWVRAAGAGHRNSAAYLTLCNPNDTPDLLLSATSTVAKAVEIHDMQTDANGTMRMRPAGNVTIDANGEIQFAPGGLHIMLIGLNAPIVAGDTISLILNFKTTGPLTISVPARATSPDPQMDQATHDHSGS